MLDIVVPAYNSSDMTWRCLQHLLMFGVGDQQRIILVDDGSDDGTPSIGAWLENVRTPAHPRQSVEIAGGHRYVRHDKNRGCHAAWNTGWRSCRGEFVAFINNDICVMPHTIQRMNSALYERHYVCATHIGGKWEPGAALEIDVEAQRYGNEVQVGEGTFFGACFAVRRQILVDLGGFDEQFFLTYGDTDFMERMRDSGVETCIATAAVAFHGGSITRRREFGRDRDVDLDEQDRARFEAKWGHRADVLARHPRIERKMMVEARDRFWSESEEA